MGTGWRGKIEGKKKGTYVALLTIKIGKEGEEGEEGEGGKEKEGREGGREGHGTCEKLKRPM